MDARAAYLISLLYFCGFSFFTSFIGVLLVVRYGFSAASVGTFFGIVGVWMVITQMFFLRIVSSKFSEKAILRYSLPVVAATIALYPFMPASIWLYVLIPLMSIPQGFAMANITALISKSVSPQKQGAALGINGSLTAFSQGLIPLLAGIGSGFFGLSLPFIVGAMFSLSAWAVLFTRAMRR